MTISTWIQWILSDGHICGVSPQMTPMTPMTRHVFPGWNHQAFFPAKDATCAFPANSSVPPILGFLVQLLNHPGMLMNLAANQFLEQLVPVFQSVFFPCRQQDLWSGFKQSRLSCRDVFRTTLRSLGGLVMLNGYPGGYPGWTLPRSTRSTRSRG